MALAFQPRADDLLGASGCVLATAQRIDVRGVEEIDASRGGRVQDRVALCRVALPGGCHGPGRSRETRRPARPSFVYCMDPSPCGVRRCVSTRIYTTRARNSPFPV